MTKFDYSEATSRNFGWVTAEEQMRLRQSTVAIAGLGGVGGVHLLTLARLGVQKFRIADFDSFEIQNFNRQAGAFVSTLGQQKIDVLARMVRDVNPDAQIELFPRGINDENVGDFLKQTDVYVDGIDFFELRPRRMLFAEAYRSNIPALTAAPLGMGVSFLHFRPGSMSFENYFRLEEKGEQEQLARLLAGLSPAMLQRPYLVAKEAVDFLLRRGPSTAMACELCAGVMGTAVLQVLLRRNTLRAAPWAMQFDAYRGRLKWTWRPYGNENPLQRLLLVAIRKRLNGEHPIGAARSMSPPRV